MENILHVEVEVPSITLWAVDVFQKFLMSRTAAYNEHFPQGPGQCCNPGPRPGHCDCSWYRTHEHIPTVQHHRDAVKVISPMPWLWAIALMWRCPERWHKGPVCQMTLLLQCWETATHSIWLGCQICRAPQSLPDVILTCKEPDISVPTSLSVPLLRISPKQSILCVF